MEEVKKTTKKNWFDFFDWGGAEALPLSTDLLDSWILLPGLSLISQGWSVGGPETVFTGSEPL